MFSVFISLIWFTNTTVICIRIYSYLPDLYLMNSLTWSSISHHVTCLSVSLCVNISSCYWFPYTCHCSYHILNLLMHLMSCVSPFIILYIHSKQYIPPSHPTLPLYHTLPICLASLLTRLPLSYVAQSCIISGHWEVLVIANLFISLTASSHCHPRIW